jgi:4-aminobutyrate aminotransferase-like enzyme
MTASILAFAEKRGLILLSCGTAANVVRLLSPLTIPDAVLEEGLVILSAALNDAYGRESARAVA